MNKSTFAFFVVALLGLFGEVASAAKNIEVHGHRGARAARPENSLPAFDYALEVGVDVLEMDLAVTKDDVLVVTHDSTVSTELCVGEDGQPPAEKLAIRSLTAAELRKFDCGSKAHPRFPKQKLVPKTPIPTLAEVFDLVAASKHPAAKTVRFNIETKIVPRYAGVESPLPGPFAELLVALVKKRGLESRVIVQSFDHRSLVVAKRLSSRIALAPLLAENLPDWLAVLKGLSPKYVSPNLDWITPDAVKAAHAMRVQVVPWTANTEEDWDWLVSCGVDGIITDDPEALIGYLKKKGLRKVQ